MMPDSAKKLSKASSAATRPRSNVQRIFSSEHEGAAERPVSGLGSYLTAGWVRVFVLLGLCGVGLLLTLQVLRRLQREEFVPTHTFALRNGQLRGWQPLGGAWQIEDGLIRNSSGARGSKILTGSSEWKNYTFGADVRLDRDYGDIGVVIRSNYERLGLDTYEGYYVGLRPVDGTIIIGRSNYGWTEARPVTMPGGLHASLWYRLRVTTYGCKIAASVVNPQTLQTGWIAFEDRGCVKSGRVGLRSVDTGGAWRNISIANAELGDYLALRQHAAFVDYPPVPDGPPWWTPWHAGLLFGCSLAFALLAQLIYFRMQRWKTQALVQERSRLAHEIHDTMAQSFAGVGYQIQGIRNSIVQGDSLDRSEIAEELKAAYQVVRKCHEEASQTISILGSPPNVQQNLLKKLADTAYKIAGNRITTTSIVHGTVRPLNLRLTNALLHIGQEAIANAVSHADPTELTISLSYEEGSVELIVEDNGRGFIFTPESSGFGILGMQKRAREASGELHIFSASGSGTQVRIRVLLEEHKLQRKIFSSLPWLGLVKRVQQPLVAKRSYSES